MVGPLVSCFHNGRTPPPFFFFIVRLFMVLALLFVIVLVLTFSVECEREESPWTLTRLTGWIY